MLLHAVQPGKTVAQVTQLDPDRAYPEPHLHPLAPLATKCPARLQAVQTVAEVQVEHPGICEAQVLQIDPRVRVYPLLHTQFPPVLVKNPAELQVVQLVAELHVRHPGILEAQVTHCAENRA